MKIGIYITVRLNSTRLSAKALKQVNNKPVIEYLIDRLNYIKQDSDLIICTTTRDEDYQFEKVFADKDIKIFHGNPDNIINRHLDCAKNYNHDYIINIDGDDILTNPEYVEKIIEKIKSTQEYSVIRSVGLPFGTNSMGYKREVIEKINEMYKAQQSVDTGWGQLITNDKLFKSFIFEAAEDEKSDVRLSLDYEEDFQVFKKIIENLFVEDKKVAQKDIIEFLKVHPEICEINKGIDEIYWKNFNSKKVLKED